MAVLVASDHEITHDLQMNSGDEVLIGDVCAAFEMADNVDPEAAKLLLSRIDLQLASEAERKRSLESRATTLVAVLGLLCTITLSNAKLATGAAPLYLVVPLIVAGGAVAVLSLLSSRVTAYFSESPFFLVTREATFGLMKEGVVHYQKSLALHLLRVHGDFVKRNTRRARLLQGAQWVFCVFVTLLVLVLRSVGSQNGQ